MAFYIRKRITIVPGLSVNVSKSGLGLSAGTTGAHVSRGPRGTQVNAGRSGVYYRKSLNSPRRQTSQAGPGRGTAFWVLVAVIVCVLVVTLI